MSNGKKTKLTISGSAKKTIRNIEIAKTQGKNSRVIEKQAGKFTNRGGSFRPGAGKPKSTTSFNRGAPLKPSFAPNLLQLQAILKEENWQSKEPPKDLREIVKKIKKH